MQSNKCTGVDTTSPARRQVLPVNEWLHNFTGDRQTNRQNRRYIR